MNIILYKIYSNMKYLSKGIFLSIYYSSQHLFNIILFNLLNTYTIYIYIYIYIYTYICYTCIVLNS